MLNDSSRTFHSLDASLRKYLAFVLLITTSVLFVTGSSIDNAQAAWEVKGCWVAGGNITLTPGGTVAPAMDGVNALVTDDSGKYIYAGTNTGFYASTNGGGTWTAVSSFGTGQVYGVATSANGQFVYGVKNASDRILISKDWGATFTQSDTSTVGNITLGMGGFASGVATDSTGQYVYVSGGEGVDYFFKSTDSGKSFTKIQATGNVITSLATGGTAGKYLLSGAYNRATNYRSSSDSGSTWTTSIIGWTHWDGVAMSSDGTVQVIANALHRSSSTPGLRVSTDSGRSFKSIDNFLTPTGIANAVTNVAISGDGQVIVAGNESAGVGGWISTNAGASFKNIALLVGSTASAYMRSSAVSKDGSKVYSMFETTKKFAVLIQNPDPSPITANYSMGSASGSVASTTSATGQCGDGLILAQPASTTAVIDGVASSFVGWTDPSGKLWYPGVPYSGPLTSHAVALTASWTAAPSFGTGTPTISATQIANQIGGTVVGQVLKATYSDATGSPTSYSYQWQNLSTGSTAWANITGATSSTYTITSTYVGKYIGVKVTATNQYGSGSESTAVSAGLGPVLTMPTITSVSITGTVQIGSTDTATVTSATGTTTTYQWSKSSASAGTYASISGATASTYTLANEDVGNYLKVTATTSNAAGTASATSPATVIVPKKANTITFAAFSPSSVTQTAAAKTLSATALSANTVTFTTSAASTICSINGITLTITGVGSCPVTAADSGNATYVAASSVIQTLTITAAAPGAPTITSISSGGGILLTTDGTATLAWNDNTPNGAAISKYRITAFVAGVATGSTTEVTTALTSTSAKVTGLTKGTTYTFSVAASNSAGYGSESTASTAVTPAGAPFAPTELSVEVGNAQLTLNYTPPASINGGTWTSYQYFITAAGTPFSVTPTYINTLNAGSTSAGTDSSYVFTGLTNGAGYDIKIAALTSANGTEASANISVLRAIPAIVPLAPTISISQASTTSATLTWAPTGDGGSAITSYTVTASDSTSGAQTCTFTFDAAGGTCTLSGLTGGHVISANVLATNAIGNSSTTSATSLTLVGVVGAPTSLVATPGNGSVSVAFTTGTSNGDTINDYYYSIDGSGGTYIDLASSASPITITSLTPNTSYTLYLKANGLGKGLSAASSSLTFTTGGAPSAASASITGTVTVGQILTAAASVTGSPTPTATYQWSRALTSDGSYVSISGATASTYTLVSGDVAKYLEVTITETNTYGTQSATSSATTQVPALANTITFAAFSPSSVTQTAAAKTLSATATAGTVTFSTSANNTVCTVSGTLLTIIGVGSCPVIAANSGNATYAAANSVTQTLTITAAAPGAPTITSISSGGGDASPTDGTATLAWNDNFPNGAAISKYLITAFVSGVATGSTTEVTTGSSSASATVTGLTKDTTYTFTVEASNSAGYGLASTASTAVTPAGAPFAPTALSVAVGDNQLTLNYTPPASINGGRWTSYKYFIIPAGTPFLLTPTSTNTNNAGSTSAGTDSSYVFTDLTNGNSYDIKIVALTSANGTEASANISVLRSIPATVPPTPAISISQDSTTSATLTWTPTGDGGSAITSYTVTASDSTSGAQTCTFAFDAAGGSCTLSDISGGDVITASIIATNIIGNSSTASATPVTIVGLVGIPTSLVATPGNNSLSVAFSENANGDTVTGYQWSLDGDTYYPASGIASPVTIDNLVAGESYTIYLKAVGATKGVGFASASVTGTPVGVTAPAAASGLSATASTTSISLAFTPGSNNGATITNYQYSLDGGATFTLFSPAQTSSPLTISGLGTGTSYSIVVKAVNSIGAGTATSAISVTTTAVASVVTTPVPTAAEIAAANQAAADKAYIENETALKIKADKAAADKIVADKAAADKAAANKIVADKAAADKAVADKVIADKVVADKVIADKVVADKVIADKVAADKVIANNALIVAQILKESPTAVKTVAGNENSYVATQGGAITNSTLLQTSTGVGISLFDKNYVGSVNIPSDVIMTLAQKVDISVVEGNVLVKPKNGFTGIILVPVIGIVDGVSTVILNKIAVNPEPVEVAQSVIKIGLKTGITWTASESTAVTYQVVRNSTVICEVKGTSCNVPTLIGPNSKVSIVVLGNDKTISTVTPIEYSAKAPIRALTVTFALNSAVLSSAQKTELRRVAKIIDREGFTRLVVSGFTDAQGSAMANKKLSAARASATAAFLAQLLPEITVKTSAQGAKTPVKAGTSASAYAANRRSEISVW